MIKVYETENHYDKLYEMFKKVKLYMKKKGERSNRYDFPDHRSAVFGMVKPRFKSQKELSYYSRKHPDVYEEILRIGKIICPFEFTSIQVNHNLVCTPHKDKHNTTRSILVSFGEYEGGEIVIEGTKYNAYHTPIEFDGKEMEHYNTEIKGNKYSLVYFS
jgi:hypothetical protein